MSLKYRNNSILTLIEYIFTSLTILQFNSIYLYSSQFHIIKLIIAIGWQLSMLLLLACVLNSVNINLNNINRNNLLMFVMIFFSLSFLFLIYNMIISSSIHLNYFFKLLIDPIFLVVIFCSFNTLHQLNNLIIRLEKVILFISKFSLIFWILFLFSVPTNSSDFISNWGIHHIAPGYFDIDFFTALNSKFIGLKWVRNSGLFVEPSMFSYVLILAVLIELFVKNNKKVINLNLIILILTIISTASTTGILVTIPAIIYHAFIISGKNNSSKFIFVFALPILLLFLKLVFSSKTNVSNMDINSSYNIRSDDILAGFKTWIEHPILGCGLSNINAIRSNMSSWRFINGTPGESAGFPVVLAQGGAIWGLFYILPTILVSRFSDNLIGLALFSFLPLLFVTAQMSYIYIVLLAYFWAIILRFHTNNLVRMK